MRDQYEQCFGVYSAGDGERGSSPDKRSFVHFCLTPTQTRPTTHPREVSKVALTQAECEPRFFGWPTMFEGGQIQSMRVVSLDILPTQWLTPVPCPMTINLVPIAFLHYSLEKKHHSNMHWNKGGEGDWAIPQSD